jgi:hypothetical protein
MNTLREIDRRIAALVVERARKKGQMLKPGDLISVDYEVKENKGTIDSEFYAICEITVQARDMPGPVAVRPIPPAREASA